MNTHERTKRLLTGFALGELSEQQERRLKTHLAECEVCSEKAKHLAALFGFTERIGAVSASEGMYLSAKQSVLDAATRKKMSTVSGWQVGLENIWDAIMRSATIKIAAIIVLACAIGIGVFVYRGSGAEEQTVVQQNSDSGGNVEVQNQQQEGTDEKRLKLAEELKKVEQMFAAGDVDGLVAILGTGEYEAKVAAANYLARIGDERALGALRKLIDTWEGASGDNAFTAVVKAIEQRTGKGTVAVQEVGRAARTGAEFGARGVLSGLITDVNTAEPIEGARVYIYSREDSQRRKATTDANGFYFFETVAKAGVYSIHVEAEEYIGGEFEGQSIDSAKLSAENSLVKDYQLERGSAIDVIAVDEDGKPVRLVEVFASYVSEEWGKGPKDSVSTDREGKARIGGLRPDEYIVTATHKHYAPTRQEVTFTRTGQYKLLEFIMEEGIEVQGRAMCSDGLPASGWEIAAEPDWWHSIHCVYDYAINEEGYFVIEHVIPGMHEIQIFIPKDGGSQGIWSAKMALPPENGLLEVNIPKPSPHSRVSISGSVKFTGGEPTGGIWVHASSDTGHYGNVYLDRGKTEFVLTDLVPGLYKIDFTVQGADAEGVVFRNIKAPSEGHVFEIPIKKRRTLYGKVVDKETSEPVTQFQYRLAQGETWTEIQDSNGVFRIGSTGDEKVGVQFRADGYAIKSRYIMPDANEATVIELGIGAAIEGVVFDESAKPIEGVAISYRYSRGRDEKPEDKYIMSTDADGRFLIEDIPAEHSWQWYDFHHDKFAPLNMNIDTEEDCLTEVTVVMQTGAVVEGYVYERQGRPSSGVRIFFLDQSLYSNWKENRGRLGSAVADANGFYRVEHVPEGICYGFREGPEDNFGTVLTSVAVENGRVYRLDFGGTWTAGGRLLEEGRPLANATVTVRGCRANWATAFESHALTDSAGRFTFYGIPAGKRPVYYQIPGLRSDYKWAELTKHDFQSGVDTELGDFDVVMGRVTVEITADEPDEPLDLLHVHVQKFEENGIYGPSEGQQVPRNELSDPYVFEKLVPGKYEAVVKRDRHPEIREMFEITAEQKDRQITVRIPHGTGSLRGKVRFEGSSSSPPMVWLRSTDWRILQGAELETDGSFVMKNIPAGKYIVGRSHVLLERQSSMREVIVKDGETTEVDIDFEAEPTSTSGYFVLVVVTEEGSLLAGASAWLEKVGKVIQPDSDTDDGKSFAADKGSYVLHVEYPGYKNMQKEVEVPSREERGIGTIYKPLVVKMYK